MKLGGEIFFHTPLAALIEAPLPPSLRPLSPPLSPPPSPPPLPRPRPDAVWCGNESWEKAEGEKKGVFQWVKLKAMVFLQSHHRAVHRKGGGREEGGARALSAAGHRGNQMYCLFRSIRVQHFLYFN